MVWRVFVRHKRSLIYRQSSRLPSHHPSATLLIQPPSDIRQTTQHIPSAIFSINCAHYKTHYDILRIKRTATQKEIKEAYIKLGKELHPDLHQNIGKDAENESPTGDNKKNTWNVQFTAINEAYGVLSRPDSKRQYDLGLLGGEGRDNHDVRRKYGSNKTYNTFEERAGAAYGYTVDPDYWKRNPDKYKIVGICFIIVILGCVLRYLAYKLIYQRHSKHLDRQAIRINQQLAELPINEPIMDNRGEYEKQYEKLYAIYKAEQESGKNSRKEGSPEKSS